MLIRRVTSTASAERAYFAKTATSIVLLLPGLPLLKEWAYAGAAFALAMAFTQERVNLAEEAHI